MTHIKACGEGCNSLLLAGVNLGIMASLHTEVGVSLSCFLDILNCDDIMLDFRVISMIIDNFIKHATKIVSIF